MVPRMDFPRPWQTLALLTSLFTAQAADSPVIAPGAKPEKAGSGFVFTEGPSADKEGNVYFTDQPNDRIVKWSVKDNACTDWMKPSGRANGTAFDKDGNLLACADEKNELWSISPDKKSKVLVSDFDGKLLNGPNDLWIRPDGALYFTDPLYKRDYWKREGKPVQDSQQVYFFGADRKTLRRVTTDLRQPNGIVGTPDGKSLYVSDLGARKTYVYDIREDGSLENRRLFCEQGSDGMTLDNEGNVYLTGRGVTVFNKAGERIEQIHLPEGWTGNVKFAGKDRSILFITSGNSVYTVKMRVHGTF